VPFRPVRGLQARVSPSSERRISVEFEVRESKTFVRYD
jgi:hypothetical protein